MLRWAIATAFLAAAMSGTAFADISRGCSAALLIHSGNAPSPAVATLDGRGFCSRLHPNQCRERARDAIKTCVRDLWAQRTQNALPSSCIISSGGRPFAKLSWTPSGLSGQKNRLLSRIGWLTCCRMRPTAVSAGFFVLVGINGDHGCSTSFTLNDNYQFACRILRDTGFCS